MRSVTSWHVVLNLIWNNIVRYSRFLPFCCQSSRLLSQESFEHLTRQSRFFFSVARPWLTVRCFHQENGWLLQSFKNSIRNYRFSFILFSRSGVLNISCRRVKNHSSLPLKTVWTFQLVRTKRGRHTSRYFYSCNLNTCLFLSCLNDILFNSTNQESSRWGCIWAMFSFIIWQDLLSSDCLFIIIVPSCNVQK